MHVVGAPIAEPVAGLGRAQPLGRDRLPVRRSAPARPPARHRARPAESSERHSALERRHRQSRAAIRAPMVFWFATHISTFDARRHRSDCRGGAVSKQPSPQDAAWPAGTVFTVGHSTLPIEQFLACSPLTASSSSPTSARCRARAATRSSTPTRCASRCERPASPTCRSRELGGLRKPRPDSPNSGWRNESFRGYADYMQTEQFGAGSRASSS